MTKNSPNILGLKLFNYLPVCLRNINSLSGFKKGLKKYLIDKTVYTLSEFFDS